jgi:hypothetical protein
VIGRSRLARTVAVSLLLVPSLSLLRAQSAPTLAVAVRHAWALRDLQFGACVDFLMEPAAAAEQLELGFQPVPASRVATLRTPLKSVVSGDTTYASWIPARLCFLDYASVTSGDHLIGPEGDDQGSMVGYWGIAARRVGQGNGGDVMAAVGWWTSNWRIRQTTELAFIPMKVVDRRRGKVPESTRDRYQVGIGKTVVTWEGTLPADSSAVQEAVGATLVFDGQRKTTWTAQSTFSPMWTRPLSGVLRVEGKDDLAKALQASPIRTFGPLYGGGDGRIEFSR